MAVRKPTVLVVDDKRANLLAFEGLLADEYKLLFANSGEEAISMFGSRDDIDVILLDVQMPGMDGYETAAAIKKMDRGGDVPIIFITAVYHEDPWIRKGYESGGIDYFSKPFDPEILRLKLRIYASFRTREALLRERELHVRESEELLRVGRKLSSVLESLTVGVLIADVDGRICQTTDEVSRILNCAEPIGNDAYGEVLGWWGKDGQMLKNGAGPLRKALREGRTSPSDKLSIKCVDGSTKAILACASPLRGLDGKVMGAVVLLQDMTEPKQIETAIQERVARLIGAGIELEESAVRAP